MESRLRLPRNDPGPLKLLRRRLGVAVGLTMFVTLLAYLGRDGYVDAKGDGVSFLDALYYATVSITTTGYGDIRPESDSARLVTTLLITPARILFLIVLVGTTVEILAERTREALAKSIWRRRLHDHVIICGFGTKGRAAASNLMSHGVDAERIVVIDSSDVGVEEATRRKLAVIHGDASRVEVLREADVHEAAQVIVAANRDDAAVLITLTARELNPKATIVASVREGENAHLLRQSGADSVITSSEAAGRLLGLATTRPRLVEVLEDLLEVGSGLDIVETEVTPDQVGPLQAVSARSPIISVIRDGNLHRFDDPEVSQLRAGDRIIQVCNVD